MTRFGERTRHRTKENFLERWYFFFERGYEHSKARSAARREAEVVSQLAPRIQYDIGASDCRPLPATSLLADNPYTLMVDAIMASAPSSLDPRR